MSKKLFKFTLLFPYHSQLNAQKSAEWCFFLWLCVLTGKIVHTYSYSNILSLPLYKTIPNDTAVSNLEPKCMLYHPASYRQLTAVWHSSKNSTFQIKSNQNNFIYIAQNHYHNYGIFSHLPTYFQWALQFVQRMTSSVLQPLTRVRKKHGYVQFMDHLIPIFTYLRQHNKGDDLFVFRLRGLQHSKQS